MYKDQEFRNSIIQKVIKDKYFISLVEEMCEMYEHELTHTPVKHTVKYSCGNHTLYFRHFIKDYELPTRVRLVGFRKQVEVNLRRCHQLQYKYSELQFAIITTHVQQFVEGDITESMIIAWKVMEKTGKRPRDKEYFVSTIEQTIKEDRISSQEFKDAMYKAMHRIRRYLLMPWW